MTFLSYVGTYLTSVQPSFFCRGPCGLTRLHSKELLQNLDRDSSRIISYECLVTNLKKNPLACLYFMIQSVCHLNSTLGTLDIFYQGWAFRFSLLDTIVHKVYDKI